jgi:hypothetical protein
MGPSYPTTNVFSIELSSPPFLSKGDHIYVTLILDARILDARILDARDAVNFVGQTVTYDPTILEALSVNLDGSILDIWSESPAIDNVRGRIRLSGEATANGGTPAGE